MIRHTRFERARIIGSRALQISMGAPPLVDLSGDDLARLRYSPIEIAKLEYGKGLVPIEVKRPAREEAGGQAAKKGTGKRQK